MSFAAQKLNTKSIKAVEKRINWQTDQMLNQWTISQQTLTHFHIVSFTNQFSASLIRMPEICDFPSNFEGIKIQVPKVSHSQQNGHNCPDQSV
jgi:hypothetical protein